MSKASSRGGRRSLGIALHVSQRSCPAAGDLLKVSSVSESRRWHSSEKGTAEAAGRGCGAGWTLRVPSSPKHHPEQPGSSTTDTLPAAAHHSRQLFFISSSLYYFLPAHIVMIPLCENFMFVYVFAIKNSGEEMKLPKCLATYRST